MLTNSSAYITKVLQQERNTIELQEIKKLAPQLTSHEIGIKLSMLFHNESVKAHNLLDKYAIKTPRLHRLMLSKQTAINEFIGEALNDVTPETMDVCEKRIKAMTDELEEHHDYLSKK